MLNKFSMAMRRNMVVQSKRCYIENLGLSSTQIATRVEEGAKANDLALWKAHVDATKNGLVLKTNDEIDEYVLSVVRDYFRTTKKASVGLDSAFTDHGLDSLDAIEMVIRIEDELGYVIDAENLEKFKKPRHFVNFIKHMEAYKTEFKKAPHAGNKWHFNMQEAFPGLPKMGKH